MPLAGAAKPTWSTVSKETAAMLLFDTVMVGNSENGDLLVWRIDGTTAAPTRVAAHKDFFTLSRTGRPDVFLTLGSDRTILGWSLANLNAPLFRLQELPERPWCAGLSNDLSTLVTLGTAIRTYDVEQNTQLSSLEVGGLAAVGAVSPEFGVVIATDDEKRARGFTLPKPLNATQLEALLRCRVSKHMQNERLVAHLPDACATPL
jgi:WD40 repeat protein